MFHLAIKLVVTAGALLLVSYVLPGFHVENFYHALLAALVLGLLTVFVRPVLLFFTFPVTLLTLGLFVFVINAAMFLLADYFLTGLSIAGFVPALAGSLLVSVISGVLYKILT